MVHELIKFWKYSTPTKSTLTEVALVALTGCVVGLAGVLASLAFKFLFFLASELL